MADFLNWFTGGDRYVYKTLMHCLNHDLVTLALVVSLCVAVFTGYLIIAYRWSRAAKDAPDSEASKALNDLKWIFILCAVCGYLWVILDVFWPGWRLYVIILAALNFITWRYVLRIEALDQIYVYLRDRDTLVRELADKQREIDRLERAAI
ncbi:hypothetical protein N8940_00820 [Sphingomonadaceae bacterium]|nr:hypothetical protein [Sphingomonadaceae bacterium]